MEKNFELTTDAIMAMNISEKIMMISSELPYVAKNLNVTIGGGGYKAVGEADILSAVKPLEHKYRVCSYPFTRRIVTDEVITTEKNGITKKELFMRIESGYRFINVDKPEEFLETISYGDGIDSGDKAPGKAATYSDKYALMKMYKICTGDDPDQEGSGNLADRDKKPAVHPDSKAASYPSKPANTTSPAPQKSSGTPSGKIPLWNYKPFADYKYEIQYMTEAQFNEAKGLNPDDLKKVLQTWDKKNWPDGGKKLHMKNEYREELNKIIQMTFDPNANSEEYPEQSGDDLPF